MNWLRRLTRWYRAVRGSRSFRRRRAAGTPTSRFVLLRGERKPLLKTFVEKGDPGGFAAGQVASAGSR
jgi:hypothetical protein